MGFPDSFTCPFMSVSSCFPFSRCIFSPPEDWGRLGPRTWRGYSVQLYTAGVKGVFAIRETPPASAGLFQRFAYVVRSLFGLEGGRCWKLSRDDAIDVFNDAISSGSAIRHSNGERTVPPEAAEEPVGDAMPSDPPSHPLTHPLSDSRADEPVDEPIDKPPAEAESAQIGAQPQQTVGPGPACARRDWPALAARRSSPVSRTARRIASPPAAAVQPVRLRPGSELATAPVAMAATLQATEAGIRDEGIADEGMAAETRSETLLGFASRVRRCSADALRQVVVTINSAADKGKRAILCGAPPGEAGPSETPKAPPSMACAAIDPAAPPVETRRVVRRSPHGDYEAALQRAITQAGDDTTIAANLQGCIASLEASSPNVMPSGARVSLLKWMAHWLSKPRERQSPALLRLAGSVLEQGLRFGKDEDDSAFAFSLRTLPGRWENSAPELALALAIHLPRLPQQSRVELTGSLLAILVKTPPAMAESIRTLLGAYSAGSARAFTEMIRHVASLPASYRPLLLAAMASTLRDRPLMERSEAGIALLRACVALPSEGEGGRHAQGPGWMAGLVGRLVEAMPAVHGFARDTALVDRMQQLGELLPEEERRQFTEALWDALTSIEKQVDAAEEPVARTAPGTAPN
ncbi:hypothetical protein [Paracidovorax citrulli]